MRQNLKSDRKKTSTLSGSIFVEQMQTADLDKILQMEIALFGKGAWSREMFEQDLKLDYVKYWTIKRTTDASAEYEIIGYAGIYLILPEIEISNVAISKEFQGRGYSNILMEKIMEESIAIKAQSIFLEVDVSNQAAIGLYEKFSFQKIAIRKHYYGIGKDAFVMKLEL